MILHGETPTVLICLDDEWLTLNNNLQISNNDFPVRDLLLVSNQDGILISWQPPLLTEGQIAGFVVTCSINESVSLVITVSGRTTSTMLPVLSIPTPASYRCCVTAQIPGSLGFHFATEICSSVNTSTVIVSPTTSSSPLSSLETSLIGITALCFLIAGIVVAIVVITVILKRRTTREERYVLIN